jgi:acyl-CoA thioesterase-1
MPTLSTLTARPIGRLGRPALLAVGALLLLGVGVALFVDNRQDSAAAALCDRQRADSRERAAEDTGQGEQVVVIGDSWTVGFGPETAEELWPSRLPGRVHVAGWSGSGFSAGASACAEAQYAERAPAAVGGGPASGTALVVVQGGINDHDQPAAEIAAGTRRLLDRLAGHEVLVVGPPRIPAMADQMPRVDAALERAVGAGDATYLSTLDWRLSYVADGVHLDPAGHRQFGDRVASVVGAAWSSSDRRVSP